MAPSITERVAELSKEIAEILTASRLASASITYQDREALKQRREERLEEIMEELRSLFNWKKLSDRLTPFFSKSLLIWGGCGSFRLPLADDVMAPTKKQ